VACCLTSAILSQELPLLLLLLATKCKGKGKRKKEGVKLQRLRLPRLQIPTRKIKVLFEPVV
jgi:hypothetical protein